jgi:hypothetical protein
MATERGWLYESIHERLAWGFRLSTADWIFEALSRSSGRETSPGSSDVSMSTTWHSQKTGQTILIGPRQSTKNLGSLGNILAQQVLNYALGSDAKGLKEVQAGSTLFRQHYMVWAQETNVCEMLLSPAVESALLDWKGKVPVVKLTSAGLSVEIHDERVQNIEKISAIIQLGEALLVAYNTL